MKGKPRPLKQHKAREGEGQSMYEVLSPFYFKQLRNTRTFCAQHGAGFEVVLRQCADDLCLSPLVLSRIEV